VIAALISAAPDLALGISYFITWISPGALGTRSFGYLLLMMLLEFLVIHSSAFMGVIIVAGPASRVKRTLSVVGLGVFYSVFIVGFAAIFQQWWPITAFWLLILNRLTPVLLGTRLTSEQTTAQSVGWAASVGLYLLWAFATTLLPVPHLGVTADVIAANKLPGEGLWVDEPYRVIAFGALYFTSQGAVEILGAWGARRRRRVDPAIV